MWGRNINTKEHLETDEVKKHAEVAECLGPRSHQKLPAWLFLRSSEISEDYDADNYRQHESYRHHYFFNSLRLKIRKGSREINKSQVDQNPHGGHVEKLVDGEQKT